MFGLQFRSRINAYIGGNRARLMYTPFFYRSMNAFVVARDVASMVSAATAAQGEAPKAKPWLKWSVEKR